MTTVPYKGTQSLMKTGHSEKKMIKFRVEVIAVI